MTSQLDPAILEQFDARLRAAGAPISDAWAPGCSDAHLDALLRPLGIELPEEARVWWRWHNGTRADVPMPHREFGSRGPLAVEDAARLYADERGAMRQLFGLDGLLTPVNEKPLIYFGCAGPSHEPVPIYVQNDVERPAIVLPSIRSLLDVWIEFLDLGVWELADDGSTWRTHHDRLPPHLARLLVY